MKHIEKVFIDSQTPKSTASCIEAFDKIYGSPQRALDLYAGKAMSEADKINLEYAHFGLAQKYFAGEQMSAYVETYMSLLSGSLNDKMFQVGSWTQIEDAWSFFRQVFTRCILTSLFGTDLFKQYLAVVKDYWEFADAIEGFILGLPRYWIPGAASQVQERLHQGIEKWLKTSHSGSEFARIAKKDPIWDEIKGSKYVQERDDLLAKFEAVDMRARAAEILSIMHESVSSSVPCILWSTLEVARRQHLAGQLTAEVSRYSPSQGATYNIQGITELPLMRSLLAEAVRLRTAAIEVRISHQDVILDDQWTVKGNIPIVALPHEVSFNTEAWAKARSQTVERPLHEFWPERFLSGKRTEHKTGQGSLRGSKSGSSFGMDGLETLNFQTRDNQPPMVGHDYAVAVSSATLAVLFNEFEVQLCDPESFDEILPPMQEVAFGMLQPLDKVAVRIRKRSS